MELKDINPQENLMERSVVSISAKVANAVEMVQRAKELTAGSEDTLIKAQIELEELFVHLDKDNAQIDSCESNGEKQGHS